MIPENEKNYYLKNEHLMWLLIIFLMVAFAGVVLFFNKNRQFPQAAKLPASIEAKQGRIYTVFYTSGVFSPTNIQINLGDTVRFRNDSFFGIRIISDPQKGGLAGLDSISDIPQGGIFSYTFTQRGIFDYNNEKNLQQSGTVIVK